MYLITLYYLKKFFRLFIQDPKQAVTHIQSVYKEWNEERIGQLVNEVLCMAPPRLSTDECPQLARGLVCNQIICVHGHIGRIVWYINNAKVSIDLVMYTINSFEISEAMNEAARRGVRVRIITEPNWTKIYGEFLSPARHVHQPRNGLMHHKFCVIDGYQSVREFLPEGAKKPLTVCLTGSLNWVTYAPSCDNVFITSSPRICKLMEQEFEHLWSICV